MEKSYKDVYNQSEKAAPNEVEVSEFVHSTTKFGIFELDLFTTKNLLKVQFDECNGDYYEDPYIYPIKDCDKELKWMRPSEYSIHRFPKISNEIISTNACQQANQDCPLITTILNCSHYDNIKQTNFINSMIHPQVKRFLTLE